MIWLISVWLAKASPIWPEELFRIAISFEYYIPANNNARKPIIRRNTPKTTTPFLINCHATDHIYRLPNLTVVNIHFFNLFIFSNFVVILIYSSNLDNGGEK